MWSILAAAIAVGAARPGAKSFMLQSPGEPVLSIYHVPGRGPSILYVHGCTFPAQLSINYPIDGKSWADDLQSRGFDVWSFDLPGFGNSERPDYSEGSGSAPGRASDAAHQIARVVQHIRSATGQSRVSIIAHSWGTIPAGMFAGEHPDWIERLVLFGPIAMRTGHHGAPTSSSRLVNAMEQWENFQAGVPEGQGSPISKEVFDPWVQSYMETDDEASTRRVRSVLVPSGPDADFADAWSGKFPYDPSLITVPTLIVRGEWDPITTDADVTWLTEAMSRVPGGVRDAKLSQGAHRMHLEVNREVLFGAVADFLAEKGR